MTAPVGAGPFGWYALAAIGFTSAFVAFLFVGAAAWVRFEAWLARQFGPAPTSPDRSPSRSDVCPIVPLQRPRVVERGPYARSDTK